MLNIEGVLHFILLKAKIIVDGPHSPVNKAHVFLISLVYLSLLANNE